MSSSTVRMTESTSTGVAVKSPDSGPPTVIIAASAAGAFLVCLLCVGALLVMSKRRKQAGSGSGDAFNPPANDRYASVSAVQMAATSGYGQVLSKDAHYEAVADITAGAPDAAYGESSFAAIN